MRCWNKLRPLAKPGVGTECCGELASSNLRKFIGMQSLLSFPNLKVLLSNLCLWLAVGLLLNVFGAVLASKECRQQND